MSSEFKIILWCVVGLTAASGLAAIGLTLPGRPFGPEQREVLDTLLKMFTWGGGAIFGLLGGLAANGRRR